jgi:hypothetical protein
MIQYMLPVSKCICMLHQLFLNVAVFTSYEINNHYFVSVLSYVTVAITYCCNSKFHMFHQLSLHVADSFTLNVAIDMFVCCNKYFYLFQYLFSD